MPEMKKRDIKMAWTPKGAGRDTAFAAEEFPRPGYPIQTWQWNQRQDETPSNGNRKCLSDSSL